MKLWLLGLMVFVVACEEPLSPPGPGSEEGYVVGCVYLHSSHEGPEDIMIKTGSDSVFLSINQDLYTYKLLADSDSIRVYDVATGRKMVWNTGGGIEDNPSFCVIWRSLTLLPIHAMM